jgi:hypothetical protein
MGRVSRAVLPHQNRRDLCSQPADDLILGVDDIPVLLQLAGLGLITVHGSLVPLPLDEAAATPGLRRKSHRTTILAGVKYLTALAVFTCPEWTLGSIATHARSQRSLRRHGMLVVTLRGTADPFLATVAGWGAGMPTSKTRNDGRDDGYFRWLHFGNWLAGANDSEGRDDAYWPAVIEDLKALHDECGPWDAVFISGDIALDGSNEADYERATELLDSLRGDLRAIGSDTVILTVPGRHDLFPKGSRPIERAESLFDVETMRRMLQRPDKSGRVSDRITALFSKYQAWSETLTRGSAYGEGPFKVSSRI